MENTTWYLNLLLPTMLYKSPYSYNIDIETKRLHTIDFLSFIRKKCCRLLTKNSKNGLICCIFNFKIKRSISYLPLRGKRSPRILSHAITVTADAKIPAAYLTMSSWWKYGNSSSHLLRSARISNSFDILSLSLSNDRKLRINQLLSPAPLPGTRISTAASTILSTITVGLTLIDKRHEKKEWRVNYYHKKLPQQ